VEFIKERAREFTKLWLRGVIGEDNVFCYRQIRWFGLVCLNDNGVLFFFFFFFWLQSLEGAFTLY
jgi:hypothetical protein